VSEVAKESGGITDKREEILNNLMWNEYEVGKTNQEQLTAELEANIDILECRRTEKDYDWMSDLFIPEAPSIFLTEDAMDAQQYFMTRDYVEVVLEGSSPEDAVACRGVKKLINSALNNRHINHYQKYMRARGICRLAAQVYAVCWWEQDVREVEAGIKEYTVAVLDENNQLTRRVEREPVYSTNVVCDRFNWEVIDPRNVFTGNSYVYNAQQEPYIIIRSEKTYQELKDDEDTHQYINLDAVKELGTQGETDTSKGSYNAGGEYQKPQSYKGKFDILERYGRQWAIVLERDKYGSPISIEPGFDDDGDPMGNAELLLVRQTMAYRGSSKVLIRFQAEPLRDCSGMPYMPIIRGLYYIHPTKKNGMSDAKYARELQIGTNDIVNMGLDGEKLAMLPTFVVNRGMAEDNDSLYIEPEHMMLLDDPKQIEQLKIQTNSQNMFLYYNMLKQLMQQTLAVFPPDLGDSGKASTTATATMNAAQNSGARRNYKSLTFDHTFLTPLYWMIIQMAWQYMHPKTANDILTEEEIAVFKPQGDYTFMPVTAGIEAEYSKQRKTQALDQNVGRLVGLVPIVPALLPLLMEIEKDILELQGAEGRRYAAILESIKKAEVLQKQAGSNGQSPSGQLGPSDKMADIMTQNQSGLPVGEAEQMARGL
jgi:hypothetical protein